jgi:hypothetical protein
LLLSHFRLGYTPKNVSATAYVVIVSL